MLFPGKTVPSKRLHITVQMVAKSKSLKETSPSPQHACTSPCRRGHRQRGDITAPSNREHIAVHAVPDLTAFASACLWVRHRKRSDHAPKSPNRVENGLYKVLGSMMLGKVDK